MDTVFFLGSINDLADGDSVTVYSSLESLVENEGVSDGEEVSEVDLTVISEGVLKSTFEIE